MVRTTISFAKRPVYAVKLLLSGISSKHGYLYNLLLGSLTYYVFLLRSTEDSLGASVAEQKASIDGLISRHPDTILSLEHETIGSFNSSIL